MSRRAPVERFEVRVDDAVLEDLRRRLAATRLRDQIEGTGWDYGTPVCSPGPPTVVISTLTSDSENRGGPFRQSAADPSSTRETGGAASVDGDDRPGDVGGPVRREERGQLGHFLGLAGALERRSANQRREALGGALST